MSLVFFFLRNVPISGLRLPRVGEGEVGEGEVGEGEEGEGEVDNVGGDSPLSNASEKGKKNTTHRISPHEEMGIQSHSLG